MRKHNSTSLNDLEIVVQLAKQKEGQNFPKERLPGPAAADSKGVGQTRKITNYNV